MAASFDHQQSGSSSLFTPQGVTIPRLFNFDLPRLKQTGQPWPEQADVSGSHRVLDIASGTGEWAVLAAQAYPQVQIVGIERDAQLVENARAQAHARGVENVSFTVMDPFESLDLAEGTFDLVNARYIVGLLEASAWPKATSGARHPDSRSCMPRLHALWACWSSILLALSRSVCAWRVRAATSGNAASPRCLSSWG